MCGVFGVVLKPTFFDHAELEPQQLGDTLFRLSESRGKEASGLALATSKQILSYKLPQPASLLIQDTVYQDVWKDFGSQTRVFLGHSRLATNGSLQDNHNNQPVTGKHSLVIHNGIIVNEADVYKKNPGLKRQTQVDTEVLVQLFEQQIQKHDSFVAFEKLQQQCQGSISMALISTLFESLFLYTNTGSIYFSQTSNFFVFTSEFYSLNQFLKHYQVSSKINQLSPKHVLMVNLKSGAVKDVSLNKPAKIQVHPLAKPWGQLTDLSDYPASKPIYTSNQDIQTLTKLIDKKYQKNQRAISALKRCSQCILPNTMPLIEFDDKGVCNYCRNFSKFPLKPDLEKELAKYPTRSKFANCIVPFSGGRDSSFGLHYLVKKMGKKPIAYTYDWAMVTDLARRNQARMVSQLGIEHIIVSADIAKKRRNIRLNVLAWLKQPDLGMVPLFMAGDKQAEYYAMQLKKRTAIDLVIYSRGNYLENEEFKWGHCGIKDGSPGGVLHDLANSGKAKLAMYYLKNFFHNPAYLNISLIDTAFAYFVAYMMPLDFVYLYHFIDWNEAEIVTTLIKEYGWETSPDTKATWRIDDGTVPFYNYIYYSMQGFTENDTFRSNQIRAGHITREKALTLAEEENQPRIPGLLWYFDTLNLDPVKVIQTIEAAPKLYAV